MKSIFFSENNVNRITEKVNKYLYSKFKQKEAINKPVTIKFMQFTFSKSKDLSALKDKKEILKNLNKRTMQIIVKYFVQKNKNTKQVVKKNIDKNPMLQRRNGVIYQQTHVKNQNPKSKEFEAGNSGSSDAFASFNTYNNINTPNGYITATGEIGLDMFQQPRDPRLDIDDDRKKNSDELEKAVLQRKSEYDMRQEMFGARGGPPREINFALDGRDTRNTTKRQEQKQLQSELGGDMRNFNNNDFGSNDYNDYSHDDQFGSFDMQNMQEMTGSLDALFEHNSITGYQGKDNKQNNMRNNNIPNNNQPQFRQQNFNNQQNNQQYNNFNQQNNQQYNHNFNQQQTQQFAQNNQQYMPNNNLNEQNSNNFDFNNVDVKAKMNNFMNQRNEIDNILSNQGKPNYFNPKKSPYEQMDFQLGGRVGNNDINNSSNNLIDQNKLKKLNSKDLGIYLKQIEEKLKNKKKQTKEKKTNKKIKLENNNTIQVKNKQEKTKNKINNKTKLIFSSEVYTEPEHYNDYLVEIDEIKDVNKIVLEDFKRYFIITEENNELVLIKNKEELTIEIETGKYELKELLKDINKSFKENDINILLEYNNNNFILSDKQDNFKLLNKNSSILNLFGFTEPEYNNSNKYISDKKIKLNDKIYLFIQYLDNENQVSVTGSDKEPFCVIDEKFKSCIKKLNNKINISDLIFIFTKSKNIEDLYNFNNIANKMTYTFYH
jgi:hypothetical protein